MQKYWQESWYIQQLREGQIKFTCIGYIAF